MKKEIKSKNAPQPIGPYSQAIQFGNMVFTSGQIAINTVTGELNLENIKSETTLVMKNLASVLNAAKMDFSNVVKSSIFLKDMNQFGEVNEIYASYFNGIAPARETVEVAKLPKNVNVEISMIALK